MLAPIAWRTPPLHYGPWEWIVSQLTENLIERGIEVTLFATGNSRTRAKLQWVCLNPYEEDKSIEPKVWECLHISNVFEQADQFELIHNHYDFLPISYSALVKTPLLTTIHGFSSEKIFPVYRKYNERTYYVAISKADRKPQLDYIATIYHGIPVELYKFNRNPGDYLLVFGRIHPDKGIHEAIQIAKKVNLPLIIAGIIQDKVYFDKEILPHVDGERVKYIGPVDSSRKSDVLGGALALLHLINFNEPFGLSVIESMACGTPVVAMRRGSMPELIKEAKTGFLVDSLEEAQEKIAKINSINRFLCRKHVQDHFSVKKMTDKYIKVYKKILKKGTK